MQTYIPDHEADVEHPEGPTEDPPSEFEEWPIWPFEIYQDELAEEFDEVDDLAKIRDITSPDQDNSHEE